MKRPIRIDGDVAYIPLTQKYEAIIDAADVRLAEGRNWYADPNRNTVYAATMVRLDNGNRKMVYLHRHLLGITDSAVEVDHKDRDGLNNRRDNLRECSPTDNRRNRRVHSNSASGLKGTSWNKRDRRWYARIRICGSLKHLGCFKTPEEAHAAYCEAAHKHFGEFMRSA